MLELRRLLYELKDQRPDIGIRFRIMGSMWQQDHNVVTKLTEKGVILHDGKGLVCVHDLNGVMQFEIDKPYQNFEPHFHYMVDASMVIDR